MFAYCSIPRDDDDDDNDDDDDGDVCRGACCYSSLWNTLSHKWIKFWVLFNYLIIIANDDDDDDDGKWWDQMKWKEENEHRI